MKIAVLFLLCCFSSSLLANNSKSFSQENSKLGVIEELAILEGMILFNSALISYDPEAFGGILTLFSPLAASEHSQNETQILTVAGTASIGLWNALELKDSKYSKGDVFKSNFIAFNLLILSTHLSDLVFEDNSESVAVQNMNDGFLISFQSRF